MKGHNAPRASKCKAGSYNDGSGNLLLMHQSLDEISRVPGVACLNPNCKVIGVLVCADALVRGSMRCHGRLFG